MAVYMTDRVDITADEARDLYYRIPQQFLTLFQALVHGHDIVKEHGDDYEILITIKGT